MPANDADHQPPTAHGSSDSPKLDEFGLPIRPRRTRTYEEDADADTVDDTTAHTPGEPHSGQVGLQDASTRHAPPTTTSEPVAKPLDSSTTTSATQTQPTPAPIESAPPQDQARQAAIDAITETQPQGGASEWSHQQLPAGPSQPDKQDQEETWEDMPAFATHTMYDDWGKVIAREVAELEDEDYAYGNAAAKGYTRVQLDDDVQSATSMDEDTAYLFNPDAGANTLDDENDRDILSQMQATKHLLTEGQRIAYVGLVRLSIIHMTKYVASLQRTRATKKHLEIATENMQMWSQKMMVRLYSHMDIDAAEQIMIEQLAEHGVEPSDLTAPLMQNARVKNPAAKETDEPDSPRTSTSQSRLSPGSSAPPTPNLPPPYEETETETETVTAKEKEKGKEKAEETLPDYDSAVKDELPDTKNLDLDLRWTVLCDLFLVLIADSIYDARSRSLLELVGKALSIPWIDICRFEKRVTDALEMQEAANKENWNEDEHTEKRQKMARNRRLVMMGLATVGGGLVIGLSAGLLAPVIGAGLAAGFTTIGVAGTSSFLAGAGGAALITSIGVTTGGTIAVRASNRRTGPVRTFEYRPLHNNKRVNLVVTVAGWMTGKVDDVRLPFSTVNPIMGDIYSVFWEPEMLTSMGQTINILATEALTQGLQQILGSTLLVALMSAMQLPLVLTKLSYLIDNPWSVSMARADMAGLILADSLIDRNLGVRPVTLVGFSLGSRVIFSCLRELAHRGAFGIVQNVYLFGSPVVVKNDEYIRIMSTVSGRFVNGYATNDWILGYLFRATAGGIMRIAGLTSVDIPGIENYDVTEHVAGHMAYRKAMPKLLREVGWAVDSDEFSEIEDPDPENHTERQRELINEIEEARRKLETKPEKKGFKALFSRNKKHAEKKEWETYDEKIKNGPVEDPSAMSSTLFDLDAIQQEVAELAAQGIEIKEIESTLPPMRITSPIIPAASPSISAIASPPMPSSEAGGSANNSPHLNLRQTKSFSGFADGSTPPSNYLSKGSKLDTYDEEYSKLDDSEISMTFESPARAYKQSPLTSTTTSPAISQGSFRPTLQSSNTMPLPGTHDRNAWADDDEFGKEKEMEMTFE